MSIPLHGINVTVSSEQLENTAPSTNAGLLLRKILSDSHRKGRKTLNSEARGSGTILGGVPRGSKVPVIQQGAGPGGGHETSDSRYHSEE